jgi:hypothetical protein
MTNANPFTHCLIAPTTLKLPSGDSVSVPRCHCLFRLWQGKPIQDTYGGKAILEFDGEPVFAELAILGTLQRAGWDGVWVDTYRRKFRRSLPPQIPATCLFTHGNSMTASAALTAAAQADVSTCLCGRRGNNFLNLLIESMQASLCDLSA